MSKVELAIKFGSNEIIVYRKGLGIIARQSSYVATPINKPKGKIYAYGDDAKRLCELKTSKYELHQPIQGIDITNGHLAQQLIINIINNALFEGGSISALVAVPCALTEKKLLELKLILHSAGISKVTFVPNEVCIRANMSSVEDDAKVAIADIGKFLVDVSVLTRYDMLKGRSYLVGGGEMDIALATYIEDNYGVKITTEQAETIKDEIASMFDNDMYTVTFEGIDLNNEYKAVTIRAN
ncbi:MAG: rod shape-determining protein, partial [Clostridia bacterium]|nr:rod shape-determining protein [Clostridia bacterium]